MSVFARNRADLKKQKTCLCVWKETNNCHISQFVKEYLVFLSVLIVCCRSYPVSWLKIAEKVD